MERPGSTPGDAKQKHSEATEMGGMVSAWTGYPGGSRFKGVEEKMLEGYTDRQVCDAATCPGKEQTEASLNRVGWRSNWRS